MAMPRKLTLETIDRICQAYAAGVKATAIASQLRLSPSVVFRAIANPAEERRLAQATIERRAAQQRASRQRLRSLERELQEHQRQLPRPSRDETPFRVRPVAKQLCPGCGGLVVRFPCVLCTCRGEAASPLRDVPAAWLTAKQAYQFRYMAQHVSELRGKTLLCYCSLDHPCHVDVICEFANQ